MPMNPRLLRPRQTIHPEAADWANRVRTNGGSVSGTTLNAVDRFVKAIHAAGIRDRFYRLNLFCGNSDASLAAVRTPLFRGPSLTGTQFGNTIDTNAGNLFVANDYAETGASGGLLGNGSTKHLRTGLATNALTVGDRHLSVYEVVRSGATFDAFVGSEGATTGSQQFILSYGASASVVIFGFGAFASNLNSSATSTGGHWLGVSPTTATGILYKNGVADTNAVAVAATPTSAEIFVFALNRQSGSTDFYGGRLGGYSIGAAFTAAQALAYYNAMQAFQTALGRQV